MQALALQTDSRGVVALCVERARAGSVRVLGTATVPRATDPAALAAGLRRAIPGLTRPEVLVALGPDAARVRRLSVPPAPEGELPPIVAMQAAREAGADPDGLVVDFLPPTGGEGPPSVLACWASDSVLDFWRAVADALGGKLAAVTPRPLAMQRIGPNAADALVTSRAGDTLDLLALRGGAVELLRTAMVGADEDSAKGGSIDRETRRTLLTLAADPPRRPIPEAQLDWAAAAQALGADADTLRALRAAAAVGLALSHVRGDRPALNLADPRRPPVAETGRRRLALLGGAAASVIAAGGWMASARVADLDAQIAATRAQIAEAQRDVDAFEPHAERVAALDTWLATDVTWLDELERLARGLRPLPLDAKDFPAAEDTRVTRLVATAAAGRDARGGKIDLAALSRTATMAAAEGRLRDESHPLQPKSIAEKPSDDAYRYDYSAELRVPGPADPEGSP